MRSRPVSCVSMCSPSIQPSKTRISVSGQSGASPRTQTRTQTMGRSAVRCVGYPLATGQCALKRSRVHGPRVTGPQARAAAEAGSARHHGHGVSSTPGPVPKQKAPFVASSGTVRCWFCETRETVCQPAAIDDGLMTEPIWRGSPWTLQATWFTRNQMARPSTNE